MLNKVILIGNVGQDPDVRVMQSGSKVANFSIATSERWKDKNGEQRETVEWHRIVVYNDRLAEILEKYLKKGSKVYIEGAIRSRKYTDHNTNQERTAFEIIVQGFGSTVKILDQKKDSNGSSSSDDYEDSHSDAASSDSKIDDDIPF